MLSFASKIVASVTLAKFAFTKSLNEDGNLQAADSSVFAAGESF